ncbi:MAG: GNAT family N-acetyltransferase [Patulibacter minatonensis]
MRLRAASVEDADAFGAIARAAFGVYLERLPAGVRPAPMEADHATVIRRHEAWVLEADGLVGGFLTLVPSGDHLLLETVAVDPALQGRGLGRRLLALAEERAAALGLPAIRLYTHVAMTENQALYERLGYREVSRGRQAGLDRVFYEKRLGRT